MSEIFISYSRADTAAVDELAARLKTAGFEPWVDRTGIRGGEQWRLSIVKAIEACGVFLIALSPQSVASVNVRKELDIADEGRKFIMPVFIRAVTIPAEMKYQLAGLKERVQRDAGVSAEPTASAAPTPSRSAPPRPPQHGERYDLVLKKVGAYKINVTRVLSDLTDLSVEEVAEMIRDAPATVLILMSVPRAAAQRVKEALEAQGATLSLEPASAQPSRQSYEVLLTGTGAYRVNVARAIRELTGVSAEDAEDLLSGTPALILSGVTQEKAEAAERALKAQGAAVRVRARRE
jgi:large subunit ribosomal protein L7/L12